jgi:hypothetical protein
MNFQNEFKKETGQEAKLDGIYNIKYVEWLEKKVQYYIDFSYQQSR